MFPESGYSLLPCAHTFSDIINFTTRQLCLNCSAIRKFWERTVLWIFSMCWLEFIYTVLIAFFWTQTIFIGRLLSLLHSCMIVHWLWSKFVCSMRLYSSSFFRFFNPRSSRQDLHSLALKKSMDRIHGALTTKLHSPCDLSLVAEYTRLWAISHVPILLL